MPKKDENWRKRYAAMGTTALEKEREAVTRQFAGGKTSVLYEKYALVGALLLKKQVKK